MILYAPSYYKTFKCIAERCEHSCCIGWEIDIDGGAIEKYAARKSGYGAVIAESISMEDTPHFKLLAHDRCPHLDERGLCRIITHMGEDYLCEICREHPRFYNDTDVAEVGIGMACTEAARIILASSDYAEMEQIGSVSREADCLGAYGRIERGRIYEILRNTESDYADRLDQIYRTYGIAVGEDRRYLEILSAQEYLDDDHKTMFMTYSSARRPEGKDEYLERFLAYLIYRHCTEAVDAEDFGTRLAFCLFCERLLASLIDTEGAESLQDVATLARTVSEEIEYSEDNTWALMNKGKER